MTNEPDDKTPRERGPRDSAAEDLLNLAIALATAAEQCRQAAAVVELSRGSPRRRILWECEERCRDLGGICHDTARSLNTERNEELRNERNQK